MNINITILNKDKFLETLEYREGCLSFVIAKSVSLDFIPQLLFAIQKPNLDEALGIVDQSLAWTMHYDFFVVNLQDSLEARQLFSIDETQRIRKIV